MPIPLMIAMVLAFGLDALGETGPFEPGELPERLVEAGVGLAAVGVLAAILGRFVAWRTARLGQPTRALRRVQGWGGLSVEIVLLAYFAWVMLGVGWGRVVGRGFDLRDAVLVDELLLLAPFVLGQLLVWSGLYPGERALRRSRPGARMPRLGRYLVLKSRQMFGMVLPIALAYLLARDLIRRYRPDLAAEPWVEVGGMALVGVLIPILAPALARLSWPARPLEPGPLRDRLERLARRFRFRCTDILVWDTGGAVVNAGVTGALPWFRYVLLSDALLECLDDREVEAVFGHEVGHITHRHLPFFAWVFLGSLGVFALATHAADWLAPGWSYGESWTALALQSAAGLACLGAYFLGLFGFLSRRCERQADVFGCRAISCGRPSCPPHADLNAGPAGEAESPDICPVAIRTFANALLKVEDLNGTREGLLASLLAWRHGRVARRVSFLNGLENRPDAERRFQTRVARLRLATALLLATALAAAWTLDSWRHLTG